MATLATTLQSQKFDQVKYKTAQKPPSLDIEKLEKEGIVEYKENEYEQFNRFGVNIKSFQRQDEKSLKLLRHAKMGLTGGAVALNFWSVFGLFKASGKLLKGIFGDGDIDEAYKDLGLAYSKSSLGGGLTGVANESSFWAIGNLAMGIFSYFGLDKLHWLSGFSIADGLSAIGMGQVKCRDEQNAFSVQHSFFNTQMFSKFRFLMPVEQSIISFGKRFSSLNGWKRITTDEPYAIFQTAGGGLISAGGVLGITSLFKNKISDSIKSLAGGVYSIFSAVNLIALFRDGKMVLKRASEFGGRKIGEDYSMKVEGIMKQIAAPILGMGKLIFPFHYHLSRVFDACGAAFAFLGFTAQSAVRFFKPDMFGPYFKQTAKITLNPLKAKPNIKGLTEIYRPVPHESNRFRKIIEQDENSEILNILKSTPEFQSLHYKSQAGLPTPLAPDRARLERYTHSERVCSIGILFYDTLKRNTNDLQLKNFLNVYDEAFKISCLIHDIGHIARSHLAEKALKGHNNDELTMDIIKGKHLNIRKIIFDYYTEKYGSDYSSDLLNKIEKIIGHKSPLSKLLKLADFTEYVRSRGGDFNSADKEQFPCWEIKDIENYAKGIRIVLNDDFKEELVFNWNSSKETIKILFDRLKFNLKYNSDPITVARELAYILGIDAADIPLEKAIVMKEPEFDKEALNGIEKLNGHVFSFSIKNKIGGEDSYTGLNKRNRFKVIDETMLKPMDILGYFEKVAKKRHNADYNFLKPKMFALTTSQETQLDFEVANT